MSGKLTLIVVWAVEGKFYKESIETRLANVNQTKGKLEVKIVKDKIVIETEPRTLVALIGSDESVDRDELSKERLEKEISDLTSQHPRNNYNKTICMPKNSEAQTPIEVSESQDVLFTTLLVDSDCQKPKQKSSPSPVTNTQLVKGE